MNFCTTTSVVWNMEVSAELLVIAMWPLETYANEQAEMQHDDQAVDIWHEPSRQVSEPYVRVAIAFSYDRKAELQQ